MAASNFRISQNRFCGFALDMLQNIKVNNKDLSAWASIFAAYCELCKKLHDYWDKHSHM